MIANSRQMSMADRGSFSLMIRNFFLDAIQILFASKDKKQKLAIKSRQRMPAQLVGWQKRFHPGVGRFAHQAMRALSPGKLFHAKNEIDFIAQQTLLAERRAAPNADFPVMQHNAKTGRGILLEFLERHQGKRH